jgi:hypothetical protein
MPSKQSPLDVRIAPYQFLNAIPSELVYTKPIPAAYVAD